MSKYGYLELFFEGPFDFEITRVDCRYSNVTSEQMTLHRRFNAMCLLGRFTNMQQNERHIDKIIAEAIFDARGS